MLWEELSSETLKEAADRCQRVCLLPIGVVERHGDHLPLGTDMYIGRAVAERAAGLEPAVVFPYYFMGQIMEGAHYPGTVAYQGELVFKLLEETCQEIGRNGFDKILLVSSHGGNKAFLDFFAQSMLGKGKDYVVYVASVLSLKKEQVTSLKEQFGDIELTPGKHAGFKETALMLAIAPQLVHMDRQDETQGASQDRDHKLQEEDVSSGFSWYARYPYHYAGSHLGATEQIGRAVLEMNAENLARAVRAVKEDNITSGLAKEFYAYAKR